MLRVGSLFSGVGGLDLGVELAIGAEPAWFCEADKPCQSVLASHYPGIPIIGDVHEIDVGAGPIDILHGGYPCQPFSVAGRRGGEDDPRHLWPEFARCVRLLRPRLVILENVAGHLVLGFDTVLADLAEMGYDARWGSVRASDVGAPHRRERLFVVAYPAGGRLEGRNGEPADAVGRGAGVGAASDPTGPGDDAVGRVHRGDGLTSAGAGTDVATRPQVVLGAHALEDRAGAAADPVGVGRHGWGGGDEAGEAGGGGDGRPDAEGHRPPPADAGREHGEPGYGWGTEGGDHAWGGPQERDGDRLDGPPEHGQAVAAAADTSGRGRDGLADGQEPGDARDAEAPVRDTDGPLAGDRVGSAADPDGEGREGLRPEPAGGVGREPADGDRASGRPDGSPSTAAADTDVGERHAPRPARDEAGATASPLSGGAGAADTDVAGREARGDSRPDSVGPRLQPLGSQGVEWGIYEPAITRWQDIVGRPAPRPTDDRGRLNPEFVEWMMGLPAGWTDGQKRTDRLRMLGNAVVPQQAELALRILLT